MVAKSAGENLEQNRLRWLSDEQRMTAALSELADALKLDELPRRIECFDISTLQGTNTVASMVVFEDAKPKKSDYRRFAIKSVEGQNDFASMQEVIGRRFKRAANETETESWRTLPSLVIVDGGKGQLSAALETLTELDVHVPIVGLAKENEEIFTPGQSLPILLPRDSRRSFLCNVWRRGAPFRRHLPAPEAPEDGHQVGAGRAARRRTETQESAHPALRQCQEDPRSQRRAAR